ncbi:MAG: proton-conducting transporter transmembrane domain-containing protein [Candidatus Dormibacteria bacterium]
MTEQLAATAAILAALAAVLISCLPPRRMAGANTAVTLLVAAFAGAALVSGLGSLGGGAPAGQLDLAGLVFFAVSTLVGATSALVSPGYLRHSRVTFFRGGPRWYYVGLHLFWALLLALPQVANLGVAWILVEASTGITCLLVAYSGSRRALEAGWKYLMLTTFGLTVALLGILILYGSTGHGGQSLSALDWSALRNAAGQPSPSTATLVVILITVGFAAKIGWAPIHHWLPDAHSEAPAPVSAMLSAALLPSVVLVLWRFDAAMTSARSGAPRTLLLGFGLASLMVAVPFLWTPLPVKRLLAYSSLEHMGVLAVGLSFASPLATAGVLLHVCGHAVAKSLGFYATIPLFQRQEGAAHRPLRGAIHASRQAATALGVSLGALSGLPPSPLFVSELLILAGGIAAGQVVAVAAAAILLALGFVGLAHQTIEGILGKARVARPMDGPPSRLWLVIAAGGATLAVLVGVAAWFAAAPDWTVLVTSGLP